MAKAFGDGLTTELRQDGFLTGESATRVFATPRRLAVLISHVLEESPDKAIQFNGPPVTAAQQAVSGFAKKNGVSTEDLIQIDTPKGKVFAYRTMARGSKLATNLDLKLDEALKTLPIPKVMRWGAGEAQFVRPVHGLVMLHGRKAVPGTVLGLQSGNRTRGHRFMGTEVALATADDYEKALLGQSVIVDIVVVLAQ